MIEKLIQFRLLDGRLQYLPFNQVWKDFLTADELAAIQTTSMSASDAIATQSDITSVEADITSLEGINTVEVVSSTDIDWSGSKYLTKTLTENTELFDTNLPEGTNAKEIVLVVTPDSNTLTLPTYWKVITGVLSTAEDNVIEAFCIDSTSEKQIDTVTLTGTSGTATIEAAGGLTKTVTFAAAGTTDLTQTAADFVTSFEADYLAQKIVITSDGADIIFTSQYAGYAFTNPTITNATGDLDGTVANTTANTSPVVWAKIYQEA